MSVVRARPPTARFDHDPVQVFGRELNAMLGDMTLELELEQVAGYPLNHGT